MADIVDIKAERLKLQEKAIADQKNAGTLVESDVLNDIAAVPSIYPTRTINEDADPDLKYMNTKYAFVHSIGGKPMVQTTVYNEFYHKEIVEFITPESLTMRYLNRLAEETRGNKGGGITLAKWWLGHQYRKNYETVTFEPDKPAGEYHVKDSSFQEGHKTYFNMWEGFGVKPTKGVWKHTCKHIYTILCNSDKNKFRYVIRWFAWAVQNPGDRAGVAVIFKGKKGSGKGTILQAFVDIFGRHGLVIANREHLTGKHNAHLENCSFLYADEAYHPGDKEVEGILKNLITEPSLTTEPKFRGLKTGRNCLHIAMATNADWVIPATEDERRYFINETDNRFAKGSSTDVEIDRHFNRVHNELKNGGKEAILFDLLKLDLKGWHPRRDIPDTEEMRVQIAMSLPKMKYALMTLLEDGVFPGIINGKGQYQIISGNLLEYLKNLDTSGNKSFTAKSLSKLCKDLGITLHRDSFNRYLIFPELGELRAKWNKEISKIDWRTNEKWNVVTSNF